MRVCVFLCVKQNTGFISVSHTVVEASKEEGFVAKRMKEKQHCTAFSTCSGQWIRLVFCGN